MTNVSVKPADNFCLSIYEDYVFGFCIYPSRDNVDTLWRQYGGDILNTFAKFGKENVLGFY